MTFDPSAQPGAFDDRKPISAEEVLKLRSRVWSDGSVSPDEAAQLFELNNSAAPSNEWTDFFVEALCDFVLSRGEPRGYVTNDEAQWLIDQIERDGRIDTHAELELIVELLERADYAPESLRRFALAEIERTVLTGSGATRRCGPITPGRIDDAEVGLLRRLVFAPAGDGPAKVSAAEAEMLFRLKDATLGAGNSPDWQRLFVQGVANHLMAHQNYVPPSPEEEIRLEHVRKPDPLGFLSRMGEPATSEEVRQSLFGEDQSKKTADHDRAVSADAQVTPGEANWLKRFFEADGARDPMEQALLDFLAEDGIRPF
jgi:hypothetical protein